MFALGRFLTTCVDRRWADREMLVLCRCAQGPAPPGHQGRHYAPAWWEPGGPTDPSLFLERCHSSCKRKPDDSHQPGCVPSALPFPPQHSEEREFFSKVRVQQDVHTVRRSVLQTGAVYLSFSVVPLGLLDSHLRQANRSLPPSFTALLSCQSWECEFLDNFMATRFWELDLGMCFALTLHGNLCDLAVTLSASQKSRGFLDLKTGWK